MGKGDHLGEFELFVLAAMERLGAEAYSVSIQREIEARTGRSTSIGAVFATLGRLEAKAYVEFWLTDPLPTRGGKARKHARTTAAGRRAFLGSQRALARMLDGLTPEFGSGKK